jgi:hypothetical protein
MYLSYIKKAMSDGNLFKDYMQKILDEFDVIECFEQPGHKRRVEEMTKNQLPLFACLGVEAPS